MPEDGVLNVTSDNNRDFTLPLLFESGDTYKNISEWSVVMNGKPFKGSVRCGGGRVTCVGPGLQIILR